MNNWRLMKPRKWVYDGIAAGFSVGIHARAGNRFDFWCNHRELKITRIKAATTIEGAAKAAVEFFEKYKSLLQEASAATTGEQ